MTLVRLPIIPSINSDRDVKKFADNLREWFNALAANGGALSAQDLINTGLVNKGLTVPTPGTIGTGPSPPQVEGLEAHGAFRNTILAWTAVNYAKQAFYEVWRAAQVGADPPPLNDAVLVGSTIANVYVDNPPSNSLSVTYYYWVRAVSTDNIAGPFSASAHASTANDPAYMIETLSNELQGATPSVDVPIYVIAAERFAIRMGSHADAHPYKYPFIVAEFPVGSGNYGVFIDTAYIKEATITNAHILNLATDKLYAGSALIGSALIDTLDVAKLRALTAKIGTALIDDLAVKRAQIDDLAVNTLKVDGGSIIAPIVYQSVNWTLSDTTTVGGATYSADSFSLNVSSYKTTNCTALAFIHVTATMLGLGGSSVALLRLEIFDNTASAIVGLGAPMIQPSTTCGVTAVVSAPVVAGHDYNCYAYFQGPAGTTIDHLTILIQLGMGV